MRLFSLGKMAAGMDPSKTSPKDAQVIASILKEMGVNEYEPRVINQLLDFSYRYIADVLEDARVCSLHASKKQIDQDDVKLAIERKLDHSFTSPPPREFLLEIARAKNSQPLPLIQEKSGLRLPPDRYCLTGCNYRLKTGSSGQKKVQSAHQRLAVSAPKIQSSSNIGISIKQGIPLVRDATSLANRQASFPSNKPSNQTFLADQRNLDQTIHPASKEKAATEIKQESSSKSSTVASLPSMEETAASAHNQKFPNLLKRKREGEEDDYDAP